MAKNKNKKVEELDEVLNETEEVSDGVMYANVPEEALEVVEVKPEPKVEPKAAPRATSPLSNPALNDAAKLDVLLKDNSPLSAIASVLVGYAKAVDGNVDGSTMADKNYNIYSTIKRVASLEYPEFKNQFDVVNLAFRVYAKSSLSQFKVVRGDVELRSKRGVVVHKTYNALVTLIAILCDPSTRAERLKSAVSLPKYIAELEDLSENAKLNIQKYYSF